MKKVTINNNIRCFEMLQNTEHLFKKCDKQ